MGWILVLTFAVTLAAGVYIMAYEPERFVAEYTLCAVREDAAGQTPAPLSMWMLIRDYNYLLDDEAFRNQVVSQQESDGKTFISARGNATDHMVVIRATGQDAMIVCGLADAVGDKLVAESESLLGVDAVRTVSRARLQPQPGENDDYVRILFTMLTTFLALSLLAVLFGSRRENVGWMTPPSQLEMPVAGQVAECGETCAHCAKQLKKNKLADGRLLTHVDRLVREGIEDPHCSCVLLRKCKASLWRLPVYGRRMMHLRMLCCWDRRWPRMAILF